MITTQDGVDVLCRQIAGPWRAASWLMQKTVRNAISTNIWDLSNSVPAWMFIYLSVRRFAEDGPEHHGWPDRNSKTKMIKKHIPNSITCCNLISGCIATACAFQWQPWNGAGRIIIGAVFDFFDGMSARLLHVSSPSAKNWIHLPMTSLSVWLLPPSYSRNSASSTIRLPRICAEYFPYFAFIMAAFSALRFQYEIQSRRAPDHFVHRSPHPSQCPVLGFLWLSVHPIWLKPHHGRCLSWWWWFASSWLMVSEIPMFALKFKQWGWKGNEVRYGFILFSLILDIIPHHSICNDYCLLFHRFRLSGFEKSPKNK